MTDTQPAFRDPAFLDRHIQDTMAFYHPRCIDRERGGFFHFFKDDGSIYDRDTRHLVSSTRFVFNYAMAYRRYGDAAYRDAVRHGVAFLRDAHRNPRTGGYAWLLGAEPKEWTHRYATFVRPDLHTNFVILVADGKELHQDTLYHLGIAVPDRDAVIRAFERARAAGLTITKPPRTTWRGTPLHEMWLEDPNGNLVEIYARLTEDELAMQPADLEPTALT